MASQIDLGQGCRVFWRPLQLEKQQRGTFVLECEEWEEGRKKDGKERICEILIYATAPYRIWIWMIDTMREAYGFANDIN